MCSNIHCFPQLKVFFSFWSVLGQRVCHWQKWTTSDRKWLSWRRNCPATRSGLMLLKMPRNPVRKNSRNMRSRWRSWNQPRFHILQYVHLCFSCYSLSFFMSNIKQYHSEIYCELCYKSSLWESGCLCVFPVLEQFKQYCESKRCAVRHDVTDVIDGTKPWHIVLLSQTKALNLTSWILHDKFV